MWAKRMCKFMNNELKWCLCENFLWFWKFFFVKYFFIPSTSTLFVYLGVEKIFSICWKKLLGYSNLYLCIIDTTRSSILYGEILMLNNPDNWYSGIKFRHVIWTIYWIFLEIYESEYRVSQPKFNQQFLYKISIWEIKKTNEIWELG